MIWTDGADGTEEAQIFEEKFSMKIKFLLLFTSAEAQTAHRALLRNT